MAVPTDGRPRAIPASSTAFVTDHLALAAFLLSHGYEPTLAGTRSGKILFRFTSTAALNADVVAFNDGAAQVEPAAYDAARIQLRKQMDALKGGVR